MIDKRLRAFHAYQRFLQNVLTLCGCWYMPTKSGKSTYYWTICVLSTMIIYTMMSLNMTYILRHNLGNMMKAVGIAISGFGAILKVVTFIINRGTLINYHRTLTELFEEELVQNKKIRTIIFSPLRAIYILTYTYFTILIGCILAFLLPAYILIIRNLFHLHLTTNYTLPLSRGFGHLWTVPDNFLYHIHLLLESGMTILSGMMAGSVDSFFGFYVYLFTSTMHAMTYRLTHPLCTDKFSDELRTCVAKHQRLLQCRDILEHIYGPIVFWHIVTNAMLLCAMIYNALIFSEFNFANASAFLTYSIIKMLQTFTYAWYGTMLTNAGEHFREGIYFSEWPNSKLDHHVRTNVILIMMQKPMTVNAFYSPVDVIMFTNFMNATVSYFFLLQSISN